LSIADLKKAASATAKKIGNRQAENQQSAMA
jgi:hypothetical protein